MKCHKQLQEQKHLYVMQRIVSERTKYFILSDSFIVNTLHLIKYSTEVKEFLVIFGHSA